VAFGKYEIIAPLGAGGMGEVFLARERGVSGFERVVAIKRLLPHLARDEAFVRLFTREALVAAQLTHSNIVPVYDFGEIEGYLYLAMEYVQGENLGSVAATACKRGSRLEIPLCAHVCAQVAAALEYAHHKRDLQGNPLNLVHRDISPQNVLLSFAGEVKLGDFGVAHVEQASLGDIRGKIAYMSPEQALGRRVDARSDLYSLGALLFELATGRLPFQGDSDMALLEAVRAGGAPSASSLEPSIPNALDEMLAQALARDPEDRFADARAMRLALSDLVDAAGLAQAAPVALADRLRDLYPERSSQQLPMVAPTLATPVGVQSTYPQAPARARRGPRWRAVVGGLLIGLVGVGAGKLLLNRRAARQGAVELPPPSRPVATVGVAAPAPASASGPPSTASRESAAAGARPSPARVSIHASLPCDVTIDGRSRGRTPLANLVLAAGRHDLRCDGAGLAQPATRTLHLPAGGHEIVDLRFGRINVGDLTPWAQVYVDGRKVDRTPVSLRLPAGPHTIRLLSPEGREATRRVEATPDHPVFIDRW